MDDPRTEDVRQTPRPGGLRWILPPRRLGRLRPVAIVPIVLGLLFAVAAVVMATRTAIGGSSGHGAIVTSVLFNLPFVLVGGALAAVGAAMLRGHAEIDASPRSLRSIERVGPLRWARTRPMNGLTRLQVVVEPRLGLGAIVATIEGRKPLLIAPGYPRETLERVAGAIRGYAADGGGAQHLETSGTTVTLDLSTPDDPPAPPAAPVTAPPATDVTIDHTADGLTVTVPPAGVLKGSKGLFGMGVAWCVFMTVFTTGAIVAFVGGQAGNGVVPFAVFGLIFWAIGIVMLVAGLNMGRRCTIIDVVGDTLLVNRRTLFALEQFEWPRSELRDVRYGASGMSVNNVPVMELQVVANDGRKTGLLSQRDNAELRWIAWTLRDALGFEADASPDPSRRVYSSCGSSSPEPAMYTESA